MNVSKQEEKWLLEEKYDGVKSPAFFDDLRRVESGEPLAYVIGSMPFCGCDIDLSYRPLIPRSETEFWVAELLEEVEKMSASEARAPKEKLKFLDIFSGSGCIGIAVAKKLPHALVDFCEINPEFVKQIKKNILHNIPEDNTKYQIFLSDVFGTLPPQKYDFILANPPYIPFGKLTKVQKSVIDYEDKNSLFAEDNGLFFIKKLILESPEFLKPGGKIYIEFDETSKEAIKKFLQEKHISNFMFKKDQYDNDRILVVAFL